MKNNKTEKVIANEYVQHNGQELRELVALRNGMYIVSINGAIPDARRKLTSDEARAWYDAAATKIGARP